MPAVHCLVTSKLKAVIFTSTLFCPSLAPHFSDGAIIHWVTQKMIKRLLALPSPLPISLICHQDNPPNCQGWQYWQKCLTALYTYAVPATKFVPISATKIIIFWLPQRSSGWESACWFRGPGFDPWSQRIPTATGQLSLWTTTREQPPLTRTRESPRTTTCNPKINK